MELPTDYTKLTGKQRKLVREQYVKEQNNLEEGAVHIH